VLAMSPRRVVCAVALSGLLLLVGVSAWAGEEEHKGNSPETTVPTHVPSLLVAGTLISPPTRIALIVILDEQGKATGNNRQPIPTTIKVVTPYEQKKEKPANFIPPPDDIEDIKKQTETFVERLKESPEFQKGLEEMSRRLRERSGAPKTSP
jgi:hypothetical protein